MLSKHGQRWLWFQRALLLVMIPVVVFYTVSLVQIPAAYILATGLFIWACFIHEGQQGVPPSSTYATHELTAELSWVKKKVEAFARKADIPTPHICVTQEPDYNAAAKYYFNRKGIIYIHDSILFLLRYKAIPKEHIELSLAHEIGHLAHHDQLGIMLYKVFYTLYQVAMLLSLGCCVGHLVVGLFNLNMSVIFASPGYKFLGSLIGYVYFGFAERSMNRNCEQLADDYSVHLTEVPPELGAKRFKQIRHWDYCADCISLDSSNCNIYESWIKKAEQHLKTKNVDSKSGLKHFTSLSMPEQILPASFHALKNPLIEHIGDKKLAAACAYYLRHHATSYKKHIHYWLKDAADRLHPNAAVDCEIEHSASESTNFVEWVYDSLTWHFTASHPTDAEREKYMLSMKGEEDAHKKPSKNRRQA